MKTNFLDAVKVGRRAFTLTEMMIACTLATLLLAGTIMGHLVGIRMFQYTRTKLGGNDDARKAVTRLIEEIRSAKEILVGNGNVDTFTKCAMGDKQEGNAVEIYPTKDTNFYVRYFLGDDSTLRRMTSVSKAAPVMAHWVTNKIVFTSEDHTGTVLTNNQDNRVIGLRMEFYQIQYPIVKIGKGELYDFYQLRTKITRRVLE